MEGKDNPSGWAKDSQWLWQEKLRRQEMRERVERGAGRGLAAHYPRPGVVPEVVPGPRLLEVKEEMEERRNRQQEEEVVEAKIRSLEDQERQREEERKTIRMTEGESEEDLEEGEWIKGADGIMRKFTRQELKRQKEESELLMKLIKRRKVLTELRRIRRWGSDQEALSRLRTEVGDDNLEWLAVQERRMDDGELSEGSLTPVEEETEGSESELSEGESEELEGAVGGVLEPWEIEERRIRERQREISRPVAVVKPKRGRCSNLRGDVDENDLNDELRAEWDRMERARIGREERRAAGEEVDSIEEEEGLIWNLWVESGAAERFDRVREARRIEEAQRDDRVFGLVESLRDSNRRQWEAMMRGDEQDWWEPIRRTWVPNVHVKERNARREGLVRQARAEWKRVQRERAGNRVIVAGETDEELEVRQIASLMAGDDNDWWDESQECWVPNRIGGAGMDQDRVREILRERILGWSDEITEDWVAVYGGEGLRRARRRGVTWQQIREMLVGQRSMDDDGEPEQAEVDQGSEAWEAIIRQAEENEKKRREDRERDDNEGGEG